jgi:hypothetical protein
MFDEIGRQLNQWARASLGNENTAITLSVPESSATQPTVNLYLFSLEGTSPIRTNKPAPLTVYLRYLVTAIADDPLVAHGLLGRLFFAAMLHKGYEVTYPADDMMLWNTLGVVPRPAFILKVLATMERSIDQALPVTEFLEQIPADMVNFSGQVRGPNGVGIANAQVRLPVLGLTAHTDPRGNFVFTPIPKQKYVLKIFARQQTFEHPIDLSAAIEFPVPIDLPFPVQQGEN